jgi:phosphoserine phosphatase RsbX
VEKGAMTGDIKPARELLDWAVATRTMAGESESGDLQVVQHFAGGVLIAVIDGLGHGPEAAAAARAASEELHCGADDPLTELVHRCHAALRSTRGIVASIASIDARNGTMSWLGIGNVEAVLFRADGAAKEALVLGGGVIGYRLSTLRASVLPVGIGDVLVFATDGVRNDFAQNSPIGQAPKAAAAEIVREFSKETDDALALVAYYKGQ